jgi:uncharacterized glyoxalase superfamily protein PhnB
VKDVTPILFVRDVTASARFFRDKLGFEIDFLHGSPPFYGAVSRDGVCIHLRFVHEPFFARAAAHEKSLIAASFQVTNVQGLFEEFMARGVAFAQKLKKQAWGGTDFQVRDPDGNVISFVTYERGKDARPAERDEHNGALRASSRQRPCRLFSCSAGVPPALVFRCRPSILLELRLFRSHGTAPREFRHFLRSKDLSYIRAWRGCFVCLVAVATRRCPISWRGEKDATLRRNVNPRLNARFEHD